MTEIASPVAATTTEAPKKASLPTKLTTEEENHRYQFIGRCVDRGINFPSSNKFGVQGSLSVQDLCNSNVKTLAEVATKIKKEEANHDPEFSGNDVLKINDIPATQWLEFFRLTIRKKNWNAYATDKRDTIKELKAKIDLAKTPEELRREAQAELDSLKEFDKED